MNRELYSNTDFTEIKKRIEKEILRRGTFKWFDPLTKPSIGQDRSSPLSLPASDSPRRLVTDKTYTINNPSDESMIPTKNSLYPAHGENPGGGDPSDESSVPNTSAGKFNVDEMKNYIIGLAKIQDIDLYYGRDEIDYLAFRDTKGLEEAVTNAENSLLNAPLHESDITATKLDPNNGNSEMLDEEYGKKSDSMIEYPMEDGKYVMPSGESNGEELETFEGLSEDYFFDDHGAPNGDGDFHPYNPHVSKLVHRDQSSNGTREKDVTITYGGVKSSIYGTNPRNPSAGEPYKPVPVFGGKQGSCNVACTGLCYQTCDNNCSESCSNSCWSRCGNACTSTCGNVCTGCSTMCYSSCKTKCENSTGYSCLKAGAKTVNVYTKGGSNGEYPSNHIESTYHTCAGCSYTCQFYPNKRTTCWDADCMSECFTSCTESCSTSCLGGCIDNTAENKGDFKIGKGRGCSAGCTINCVGKCQGTCEGQCVFTCWHSCKQTCSDNCSYQCVTNCGSGCADSCLTGCKDDCNMNESSHTCDGNCASMCQSDCNGNCVGWGCKSICGIESAGACEANCRLNCMTSSCTSLCENACSGQCTDCVNSCGFQCGPCTSECSTGCGAACNITCTSTCKHSCENNCVHSCAEECGGCSNLCFSCVGMCVGLCSVKCEYGCSNCANLCSWWCDTQCNRTCFVDCSTLCITNCTGSCATYLTSDTTFKKAAERDPISEGYEYPHPKNRWEERESFKIFNEPGMYIPPEPEKRKVVIGFDEENKLNIDLPDGLAYVLYATTLIGGVWNVDSYTGEITINEDFLTSTIPEMHVPSLDGNRGVFVIQILYDKEIQITEDDIDITLPFGFETIGPLLDSNKNTIFIIQRHITTLKEDV